MKSLELNIFTNCTKYAPETFIIERTYKSFCAAFGDFPIRRIYLDQNPFRNHYAEYKRNLKSAFPHVEIVNMASLSEGYIRSIQEGETDYIFQLEHDWIFNADLIRHSMQDILECMDECGIYHFRFNQRSNKIGGWNHYIRGEKSPQGIEYCMTDCLSNNPHIIDRWIYREDHIKLIKIMSGSKGIECQLSARDGYEGAVYGPPGYPATIVHTDGRGIPERRKKRVLHDPAGIWDNWK